MKNAHTAKAIILSEGNDPNCVHTEKVVGFVGECTKCHRVKQYPDNEITDQQFTSRDERKGTFTEAWIPW